MSDKNSSIVLHGKGDLRIQNTHFPDSMKQNDVVLKTNYGGISGPDIQLWLRGGIGEVFITEPIVLGYEISATVIQLGSKVENLKVGDRVTIEPYVPCNDCRYCQCGNYNLCTALNQTYFGPKPTNGYFREYFIHPAHLCHKLSQRMSAEEGTFVAPLATAVYAAKRAGVEVGMSVVVIGTGTMAMLIMLTAKAMGITQLCVVGINEEKLTSIRDMGIQHTVLIEQNDKVEDTAKKIKDALGSGAQVVFECAGNDFSLQVALETAQNGGKVVPMGIPSEMVTVSLTKASLREVDIIGVNRSRHSYKLAIYLLHSGRVNVKSLITHRFRLRDAQDAFNMVKSRGGTKVLIEF